MDCIVDAVRDLYRVYLVNGNVIGMQVCVAMSLDLFDRAFWQNLYEAVSTRVVSFSPTPVVYAIVDSVPHVYLLMLWIVGITTIVSLLSLVRV